MSNVNKKCKLNYYYYSKRSVCVGDDQQPNYRKQPNNNNIIIWPAPVRIIDCVCRRVASHNSPLHALFIRSHQTYNKRMRKKMKKNSVCFLSKSHTHNNSAEEEKRKNMSKGHITRTSSREVVGQLK